MEQENKYHMVKMLLTIILIIASSTGFSQTKKQVNVVYSWDLQPLYADTILKLFINPDAYYVCLGTAQTIKKDTSNIITYKPFVCHNCRIPVKHYKIINKNFLPENITWVFLKIEFIVTKNILDSAYITISNF